MLQSWSNVSVLLTSIIILCTPVNEAELDSTLAFLGHAVRVQDLLSISQCGY